MWISEPINKSLLRVTHDIQISCKVLNFKFLGEGHEEEIITILEMYEKF